jgi:hypothetical protein
MQYQVPQFIEIEDKIFGPLTFKQFAYVAGGGAMCFVAYKFLPIFLSIFIIVPVGGLSLALAFYNINNRPFIFMVESAVKFFFSKKLYLWQKTENKKEEQIKITPVDKNLIPKLSESKLRDLTWSLDINDTINSQDVMNNRKISRDTNPKDEGDEINSFQGLQEDIKKIKKWQ